jgi:hypothetical protein
MQKSMQAGTNFSQRKIDHTRKATGALQRKLRLKSKIETDKKKHCSGSKKSNSEYLIHVHCKQCCDQSRVRITKA